MDSHLDRSRRTSINRHSSCCRCRWRPITKLFFLVQLMSSKGANS
jgi:hypothetical protein